jgi:hypothetical protein
MSVDRSDMISKTRADFSHNRLLEAVAPFSVKWQTLRFENHCCKWRNDQLE